MLTVWNITDRDCLQGDQQAGGTKKLAPSRTSFSSFCACARAGSRLHNNYNPSNREIWSRFQRQLTFSITSTRGSGSECTSSEGAECFQMRRECRHQTGANTGRRSGLILERHAQVIIVERPTALHYLKGGSNNMTRVG